ncbi:hypothetical protein GCM10011494_22900 [Novosphingobium endophyticum]|uniref:Solute-binding protein family 3/N-terminal domain-containing protein n=1 Tax=Novosphingobium endophyticum TaxID=1955250 RepID=A0A916X4X9_9SPHN|nr:transporter substrate-binding domain-containing protein [Novosphingobium endophyticum]GGC03875.1 hypothetical protein GCM10011494_22900 [Novosphingobium endophyticum]
MKGEDGEWSGLAIDLWRDIAVERGDDYRFVETDLPGMVDGVADGRFDASVGALTITSGREERVDFTHPFYATGFGIAVHKSPGTWVTLLGTIFPCQGIPQGATNRRKSAIFKPHPSRSVPSDIRQSGAMRCHGWANMAPPKIRWHHGPEKPSPVSSRTS